jgi:putative nucleotidyltransferase with HDIG domain
MAITQILQASGPELYERLMGHVRNKISIVAQDEQLSIDETRQVAQFLLDRFGESTELLEICMGYYDPTDFAVSHAVNVSTYAMRMAIDMGLPDADLEDTVVAGLLHDIGFAKVPVYHKDQSELIPFEENPSRVLTDEDRHLVELHSKYGAEAILLESDQANRVSEIILQHHEKDDGSGYPRGLKESEQLTPARIISLIDTYEALIHPRPFRDALAPPAGIESLKRGEQGMYSPELLRDLLLSLSLFPVGYYVQLTDNSVGKVIKTYRKSPLRPDVELIVDQHGKRLDAARLISLTENQMLGVARVLPRFGKD